MEYQKMKAKEIIKKLESLKIPRSTWKKGVLYYALFIMDKFESETEIESEKDLLNGADNWRHASYSGCFYVSDEFIMLTLYNKSKSQMTRKPKGNETWLDVQARALSQASQLILSIMKNPQKIQF